MAARSLERLSMPQLPVDERKDQPIVFNASYLDDIPNALNQWNCKRTVLVVSKTLDQTTDIVKKLEQSLGARIVDKQVGVRAHSPYADVLAITRRLIEHNADSLVSIGSGSYSDACKIARLLQEKLTIDTLTEESMEALIDQDRGWTKPGIFQPPKTKFICVPTSLSVGELNAISSASNSRGKKQHFCELGLAEAAPSLILMDPQIAFTAPLKTLWLVSGARAIDHGIETLCGAHVQEPGLVAARRGLREVIRGLMRYRDLRNEGRDSNDLEVLKSITDCQKGARDSILGLFCYGSYFGPSHAIGHQVGSVAGVAHGLTSCICLPATLKYEKEHPEVQHWNASQQAEIVQIFNEELGWKEDDAGAAVERFYRSLELPTRFHEVGVTKQTTLEEIAERTLTDIWGGGPKQLTTAAQVLEVLEKAK